MVRRAAIADWGQDEWEALLGVKSPAVVAESVRSARSHEIKFSTLGRRGKQILRDVTGPCVYGLTNEAGDFIYIGLTNDLWRRFKQHQHKLFKRINEDLGSLVIWEMPYADALKVEHLLIEAMAGSLLNKWKCRFLTNVRVGKKAA